MRNSKNLRLLILIVTFLSVVFDNFSGGVAYAQQAGSGAQSGLAGNETTAWFLDAPSLDEATLLQVSIGLEEALSGEKGRHVVGAEAFDKHVKARKPPTPSCLYGVGECLSAESMAFDALDLALVVRVKIRKSGGKYEAAYSLIDRRGAQDASDRVVQALSPRDLAFTLVREIYNATGLASFTTNPPGATVLVDGAPIGVTPLEHRLPIGRHQFSVRLERYKNLESSLEVSSKETTRVEVGLELQSAILILDDPPPGALISIQGVVQDQSATQPIELPPGTYSYELQAEGYRPIKETVTLEPGMAMHREAKMDPANLLLREVTEDAIVNNSYILRLSADFSFQNTSFRGARAHNRNEAQVGDIAFDRFEPESGEQELDPRRFFSTRGLRLDFSYMRKNFGLGLLSLAYLTDSNHVYSALVEDLATGAQRRADVVRVSRFQVRPFQLQYRKIMGNVVPTVEAGLGLNFQWVTLVDEGQSDDTAYSLRQTEPFWTIDLGVQYFFTPNWFATLHYNFHDHFNLGVGTEHTIGLGVGGAFSNLFGFEPEPPSKL